MVGESLSKLFGLNHIEEQGEQVKEIYIDLIRANPYQPRKRFDTFQLDELANSIRTYGVIQPILVRQAGKYYELIAGERRLRACKKVGLKTIPALIKNICAQDSAELALIENLQREDLNFFEEAEGYRKLIEDFQLTQEEVARRVGKSQSTIANKLRVLKLPKEVRENIVFDVITERHARALLKLPDPESQLDMLREIYARNLNVRETEDLINNLLERRCTVPRLSHGKRVIRIFKDLRIYINTLKAAVTTIKEAGIGVSIGEKEYADYVEITIQLRKPSAEVF